MALCVSTCAVDTPLIWAQECDFQKRESGILNLIFFRCDWQFSGNVTINNEVLAIGPVTDLDAWRTGITNRFIVKSPDGFGDEPQPSFTTERVTSCVPEAITGETHVVNFTSKNTDPDNLTDCTWWNDIRLDYNRFRFGYCTCDGFYYGDTDANEPFFRWAPTQWGRIIDEDSNVPQKYEVSLSWNLLGLICPRDIPGLKDIFNIDVPT